MSTNLNVLAMPLILHSPATVMLKTGTEAEGLVEPIVGVYIIMGFKWCVQGFT